MKRKQEGNEELQDMPPSPAGVYGVIDTIRPRPAMYLGEDSLTALFHYLGGYEHALVELQLDDPCEPPFRHFSDWVHKEYGFRWGGGMGWHTMILRESADQPAALNTFFEFTDRFRARRRTPVANAILGPQHRITERRTRSAGGWNPLPLPVEIRVVRFDPDADVYATLIYGVRRKDADGLPIDFVEDHYSNFAEAVASYEMEFGLQADEWIRDRD